MKKDLFGIGTVDTNTAELVAHREYKVNGKEIKDKMYLSPEGTYFLYRIAEGGENMLFMLWKKDVEEAKKNVGQIAKWTFTK